MAQLGYLANLRRRTDADAVSVSSKKDRNANGFHGRQGFLFSAVLATSTVPPTCAPAHSVSALFFGISDGIILMLSMYC